MGVRFPGFCWEWSLGELMESKQKYVPVVRGGMVDGLRVMRPKEKAMWVEACVGLSTSWQRGMPPVRGPWPGLLSSCPESVSGFCAWTFPSERFPWPGSASVLLGAFLPSRTPWKCGSAGPFARQSSRAAVTSASVGVVVAMRLRSGRW